MSLRTTLLLLVMASGLAAVVLWQRRREEAWVDGGGERLFADVDVARIRSIRLEALDRPPGVRVERDEQGGWRISDPIDYPARASMMAEILRIVRETRARPATREEIEARDAPFERLGIFDVEEQLLDGTRRTTRIEVGDVDLDGVRLWVRRDGRILRSLRTLDTMLQRNLDELRSDRILEVQVRDLIGFRREGVDLSGGIVVRVDLEARRDGYAWRMHRPLRAQLDPVLVELFLSGLTTLRVAEFTADEVESLSPYGLSTPQVRLRLEDRDGVVHEAIFGQGVVEGGWYAHRPDRPWVWRADERAGSVLFVPFEELLDTRLVRVLRDDVQRVRLLGAQEEIVLERDRASRERRWTVAGGAPGSGELSMPLEADPARVDEVLGTIEAGELLPRLSADPEEVFPAGSPPRGLWVEDVHGIRQGGRIGGRASGEDGTPGYAFQREGDDLVCLLSASAGELLELRSIDLRSRAILRLDEVRLRRLTLTGAERSLAYVREAAAGWRHPETGFEARELRPVLDRIFFLRASEHLPQEAGRAALADVVTVETRDVQGDVERVVLGRDGQGRVVCEHLGMRSLLADPDLLGDLEAILSP